MTGGHWASVVLAGLALPWIILAALILLKGGLTLFERPRTRTRGEVAAILRNLLDNDGPECLVDGSAWDDFVSVRISDSQLDRIRARCARLPAEFPPEKYTEYCSADGRKVIREYIRELERAAQEPTDGVQ